MDTMKTPLTLALTCVALLVATKNVLAADRLPLEQLKPGKWAVERTIRKVGEEPRVRKSDYCASPKKEIGRVLTLASWLCKSDIKKLSAEKYEIVAACNLPGGLSGTNRTEITLHNDSKYSIETHTKGTKFGGQPDERTESIIAVRVGDCAQGEAEDRVKTAFNFGSRH
jgi:hypothetical protein